MPIFDISVPISAATPVYPGDPAIEISDYLALARGDAANVSMLRFGAHTATHVDAPAHFIQNAPGIPQLSLETLIGTARVIEVPTSVRAISIDHLGEIGEATRVLFKTRNSAFWRDPQASVFREDYTYLTAAAARHLVERGVRLVGIDYLSIEQFKSTGFETHLALLSEGVVILEGLDLGAVAAGVYELICLPLKLAGGSGDGSPARAVLRTLE
jgi:arylformamidase